MPDNWKGVVVYIGGCFAEGIKDADAVTTDEEGSLYVWQGDEFLHEYPPGMWVDYKIEGGE